MDRSRDSGELATKIEAVNTELKKKIEAVQLDVAKLKVDVAMLKASVRYIFWVSGIQTAALVAILLKLY